MCAGRSNIAYFKGKHNAALGPKISRLKTCGRAGWGCFTHQPNSSACKERYKSRTDVRRNNRTSSSPTRDARAFSFSDPIPIGVVSALPMYGFEQWIELHYFLNCHHRMWRADVSRRSSRHPLLKVSHFITHRASLIVKCDMFELPISCGVGNH